MKRLKKLIIAIFISMMLVVPMNNNYVEAAKQTPTKEVATTNYTITYNLNGGKNNKSNPLKYTSKTKTIKLKDATRNGYTFEGWYSDTNFKKKVTSIKKGSKGNITLYAKWERFNITYQLNGGTNNKSNPTTYNKKTKTIKLKNPTRKGYDFLGWYKDAKFKKKVTSIKKGSKGNITLYAKWESNEDYKIAYNLNGGTNNKSNPNKYNKKTKTIKLKNPTKAGYTFAGWYKDAKFKKKITSIKKGSKGNITLYAKWTANTYTIKFNKNGATSGKMSNQTKVKYDANVKLNANKFAKKGYAFVGWNTKKDGKGKMYTDKASIKNLVTKNKGTITLYAIWGNEFKITYNLNGGTNNKANPSKYKLNTEVNLKNPTKKDNKFLGWYTDAKFKNKVTKIAKGTSGNITLYAKWESTKKVTNKEQAALKILNELIKELGEDKIYLSYQYTINVLKDEGYTEAEAKYAADNCGINWKNQANEFVKGVTKVGISYKMLTLYMKDLGYTDTEIKNAIANNKVNWTEQAKLYVKNLIDEGIRSNIIKEYFKDMEFTAEEEKAAFANIKIDDKQQAVKAAKEMLKADYRGYSYKSILKELQEEYRGFTEAEAKYAADNCGANWNAQALKEAKILLKNSNYSSKRIIAMLQDEWTGFTEAEAKYAADNCGANWNEQALKRATSLLEYNKYSYKSLLTELQADWYGFTEAEAKYAVDHCGANWKSQALARAKENLKDSNEFGYTLSANKLFSFMKDYGYTDEEAKYAVDNCGANWKEQALKEAKNLIENSAYSYQGLIKTLQEEYEGFTEAEAKYAVDSLNASWKDQAVRKAQEFMQYDGYTYENIIEILSNDYYLFTAEEAKYGADNCGYFNN